MPTPPFLSTVGWSAGQVGQVGLMVYVVEVVQVVEVVEVVQMIKVVRTVWVVSLDDMCSENICLTWFTIKFLRKVEMSVT